MDLARSWPPARRSAALRSSFALMLASLAAPALALAAPRVAAGDLLSGRYRLEQQLGEGGLGAVFAATDLLRSERVAIKWLAPSVRNTTHGGLRLLQEYRALARVRHPNVVRVHRVARHRGSYYLVMELLEGRTLDELLRAGRPLALAHAVSLLLPAIDAVAAAHDRGVVHRDIKPGNIFVGGDGVAVDRSVKVIDFGLSKVAPAAGERDLKLTLHGNAIGTPSYMAPEQIRGAERVDRRADVYGFGIVLYEMLAARLPFTATDYNNAIIEIATGTPRPLAELRPELPAALSAAVMKAIAREPDARFESLHALRQALTPFARPAELVAERERPRRPGLERTAATPPPEARGEASAAGVQRASLATGVVAGALLLCVVLALVAGRRAQGTS